MEKLSKEEKKKLKQEAKESKKESKKIKKEEKEIVKEVNHKNKKPIDKNMILIGLIILLAVGLLTTTVSCVLLARKISKLENKYDDLSKTSETIMGIISTDDGTGDKINNISTDLETIKADVATLTESNNNLVATVESNNQAITNLNNKAKSIDETKLKSLYSLYDWNKGLKAQATTGYVASYAVYNTKYTLANSRYGAHYYAYCLTSVLQGEMPEICK